MDINFLVVKVPILPSLIFQSQKGKVMFHDHTMDINTLKLYIMKKDMPESSKQFYSNTIWSTTSYNSHGNRPAKHVPKRNVHTSQTTNTTAVSSKSSQLQLSSAKNVWDASSVVGGSDENLENIYNVSDTSF